MSLLQEDLLEGPQLFFDGDGFWLPNVGCAASVDDPFETASDADFAAQLARIDERRRKVAENLTGTVQDALPMDYGHLVVIAEGAEKVLKPDEKKPDVLFGIAKAESVAGSIGHKILELAECDTSTIQAYIDRRYGYIPTPEDFLGLGDEKLRRKAPVIHQRWAERVADAIPGVTALLKAPKGKGQEFARESRIRITKRTAIAAVQEINDELVVEQENGDGKRGPFELAVGASPQLTHRGRASGLFSKELAKIDPEAEKQPKDIRRLTRLARTHHLTRRGNMLVCPVSRPDVLDFRYDETDQEARNAAMAIKAVFDSNIGFDADKLADLPVTFTVVNSRTEEEEEVTMDGLSAVNWAAGLMCAGKLECHIVDYKFQTHIGETWEKMQWLWDCDDYDGDIAQIVTDEHLESKDREKFGELQKHWRDYELDLARTGYSVLSFFKYGVREFRTRNKGVGAEYPVSWTKLRNNLHAYVLAIDFDITKTGQGLERDERNADCILPYMTSPPLATLGVPKTFGLLLREIPQKVLRKDIENRGPELRKMARNAGRVLLRCLN